MDRGPSQLLLTRIVCVLVIGAAAYFWNAAYRAQQDLAFLGEHAHWLYPYVPDLGPKDFGFTIDFFGMKFSGTYKEDWEVLFAGATEKPDLFFCRDIGEALSKSKTVSVAVDVGANKGVHSLFFSQHFDKVVAYEPIPALVHAIQGNIDRNGIHNIIVRPVGLGDAEDVIPFFQGTNVFTGSYREDFNDKVTKRFEFEVKRGDDELERLGLQPDLIKIDVEGFEKPVLEGLASTLDRSRPVILMELLPETIRERKYGFTNEAALRGLFPDDYQFFEFSEYEVYSGAYSLRPLDYDARKHLEGRPGFVYARNIVAVPTEKIDLIPKAKLRR